jgi:hypothetical protein
MDQNHFRGAAKENASNLRLLGNYATRDAAICFQFWKTSNIIAGSRSLSLFWQ